MRNELLYIGANNQLVDMDDNTNITLKYKSNIFTDIGKIVSSNSYTIKLPNTAKNQSVFLHADLPACRYPISSFLLDARYIRNGVEILKKAKVYLMKTSDMFEIALIWGNASHFAGIADGKKKLTELKDRWEYEQVAEGFEDYCELWDNWYNVSNYGQNSDFFYPRIDYNIRESDKTVTYHPAVRANWILKHIEMDNDVVFSFPEAQKALLNKLFIPLLTRKDSAEYSKRHSHTIKPAYYVNNPVKIYFENKSYKSYYGKSTTQVMSGGTYISGYKTSGKSTKFIVSGKVVVRTIFSEFPNDATFLLSYTDKETREQVDIITATYSSIKVNGNNSYTITFEMDEIDSDSVPQGSEITFGLSGTGDVASIVEGSITVRMESDPVWPRSLAEDVYECGNGHYPIIPNLPDITQLDFIKAISTMLGVFAVPIEGSKTIRFVSVDDVVVNKKISYDWTKQIVATYRSNKPKEINFSLDGFAQHNMLRYKSDESVKSNCDGDIPCNVASMDKEKDMAELKFAATDMRGPLAFIRLYSYDKEGKQELNKVEPRILEEINIEGKSGGTFANLSFERLIERYYGSFKKALESPKVIKEKIEIQETDLQSLDVTRPVYLAQYGKYYAILSVTAEHTGIANVELLQLD